MKIYRYFMRGLEQQMWFFGQDARHGGNLLVRHGFEKLREPRQPGSSRYRIGWREGVVELHSHSAGFYARENPGFIYVRGSLSAYTFTGGKPPKPNHYHAGDLIVAQSETEWTLFHGTAACFLEWLELYEAWIEKTAGTSYRAQLFTHYHQPWLPPEDARRWFRLYREDARYAPVPRRRKNLQTRISAPHFTRRNHPRNPRSTPFQATIFNGPWSSQ